MPKKCVDLSKVIRMMKSTAADLTAGLSWMKSTGADLTKGNTMDVINSSRSSYQKTFYFSNKRG